MTNEECRDQPYGAADSRAVGKGGPLVDARVGVRTYLCVAVNTRHRAARRPTLRHQVWAGSSWVWGIPARVGPARRVTIGEPARLSQMAGLGNALVATPRSMIPAGRSPVRAGSTLLRLPQGLVQPQTPSNPAQWATSRQQLVCCVNECGVFTPAVVPVMMLVVPRKKLTRVRANPLEVVMTDPSPSLSESARAIGAPM